MRGEYVSGPMGKEHVHFEAPKADRLPGEMKSFLDWFEGNDPIDSVLKAGLAHLWSVTMHPFDDGNGRIARAIADMALARSENSPQRFCSMTAQIRQERKAYYDILEDTQQGTMDVTPWMEWFPGCLGRAIDGAQVTLSTVLGKARFWERRKMCNSTIDSGWWSIVYQTGSKASSRPPNMPSPASALRTRLIVIFSRWSITASSCAIRKEGAARAIRSPHSNKRC